MSRHCASSAPGSKPSATDLVNTEAMPNEAPAATASSTLRVTLRRTARAARNSTAAPAPVAASSTSCSGPLSVCDRRSPPVRASSPARPTVAINAPRQAAEPARRPTNTAASGSANTIVRAPSGCTRLNGPNARATTWSTAPTPFSATATHQPGCRGAA